MTERELDRRAAHRLAIIRHAQELTGNVAKTCRYYGISRQVYYKWLRRYEEGGLDARWTRPGGLPAGHDQQAPDLFRCPQRPGQAGRRVRGR